MNRHRTLLTAAIASALTLGAGAVAQEPQTPPASATQPQTPDASSTTPTTSSHRHESTTTTRETHTSSRQATAGEGGANNSFVSSELALMDLDRDGVVSAQEHEAGARKMFEQMDANRDGEVTSREMSASSKSMPSSGDPATASTPAEAKIAAVDRDADGKLTAEEHAQASRDMFGRLDGDRDGALSRNEIQMGRDMVKATESPTSQQ